MTANEQKHEQHRVFIVAYRFPSAAKDVPVASLRLQNSCVSAGGHFLVEKGHNVVWVGAETDATPGSDRSETVALPVYLDPKTSHGWYDYCKTVLWPLFHYVGGGNIDVPELWQNYYDANAAFATVIAESYKPGDSILIQDYHLMLLPNMLRKKLPEASIAYFHHLPWSSSEIYRALPVRLEVLNGVLGASLVGFQTYSYMKHFSSVCTRLLGLTASDKGLYSEEERFIRMDVFPAGIDSKRVSASFKTSEMAEKIAQDKKSIHGKRMVVSNDRIEYTEGVPHKLKAWETFLTNYPEWQGQAMLTLCCETNSAIMSERSYKLLQEEIEQQVAAINGKFGTVTWTPVRYLNHSMSEQELFAIFASADVGLWTPLRAGMNLTCHNYICSQQDNNGVLIMSELAGSAHCLSGCVLVNPWDDKRVAKAVHEALTMSEDQRKTRFKHCYDYVLTHDASFWIDSLLNELKIVTTAQPVSDHTLPPRADLEQLANKFTQSQKRLVLLDYDGTLSPLVAQPEQAAPSPRLLTLLSKLADQDNTYIYVISGRDRTSLGDWLGHLSIGMSCEHGLFFRPYTKGGVGEWQDIIATLDTAWKTDIRALFKDFTDRTPGSMIESKEVNLTWHYRNADPDFGEFQKKELLMHLQDLPGMPIDILPGKKAVEVRPQGINKGSVVRRILGLHKDVDFAICMGDDKTDEDMFVELDNCNFENHYTIMVDKKHTTANLYVDDQSTVVTLLQMFAERQ